MQGTRGYRTGPLCRRKRHDNVLSGQVYAIGPAVWFIVRLHNRIVNLQCPRSAYRSCLASAALHDLINCIIQEAVRRTHTICPRNRTSRRWRKEEYGVWRRVDGKRKRRPSEIETCLLNTRQGRVWRLGSTRRLLRIKFRIKSCSCKLSDVSEGTAMARGLVKTMLVYMPRELRFRRLSVHLYSKRLWGETLTQNQLAANTVAADVGFPEGVRKAGVQQRKIV